MEETLSKLNGYKRVIEVEDFIDFLYSNKLISEENYYVVHQKKQSARIHELFEIIHSKENLETVFDYLKDKYPEEANTQEQERAYRVSVALGGFPKLPPNYIPRQSLVTEECNKLLLNTATNCKPIQVSEDNRISPYRSLCYKAIHLQAIDEINSLMIQIKIS